MGVQALSRATKGVPARLTRPTRPNALSTTDGLSQGTQIRVQVVPGRVDHSILRIHRRRRTLASSRSSFLSSHIPSSLLSASSAPPYLYVRVVLQLFPRRHAERSVA